LVAWSLHVVLLLSPVAGETQREIFMKTLHLTVAVCSLLSASLASRPAWADVFSMPSGQKSLEFVTVGDPGNAADTRDALHSPGAWGAVPYIYQMGRYDVTRGQYCQFLNAMAKTDLYGLYRTGMSISRSGAPGSYSYSVGSGLEDYPVTYVSWADAARFCNWLATGATEAGCYTLNGATSDSALAVVVRNPAASYVVPSEDEWYKAAYYKGGSTHAGYWTYPTRNDSPPSNELASTGSNNANYSRSSMTPVGYFAGSPGPYETFDMGGNAWQWTETINYSARYMRGGSYNWDYSYLHSGASNWLLYPTQELENVGFRVALVPEPATLSLLALGGLLIARRRQG
jgi:formylglycine-generating enzyme